MKHFGPKAPGKASPSDGEILRLRARRKPTGISPRGWTAERCPRLRRLKDGRFARCVLDKGHESEACYFGLRHDP